ncbi:MAG: hypothetical protein GQ527_10245, partial [Bacteroidales bacterium]|nr:hypothetical protein [Bacteroidales bacterium]
MLWSSSYKNRGLHHLILVLLLFLWISAQAQDPVITNLIEDLTAKSEQEYDYSDLLDEFMELRKEPININSKETKKLISLFLLDELMYENLQQYIDSNGQLFSPQELLLVEGFGLKTLQNLLPFIKAEPIYQSSPIQAAKVLKYGRHQVFLRYQRTLQTAEGYADRNDSVWNAKPNSKYLGNADKYYLKYLFKYSNKLKAGLVAEKDAGEIFLENIENPTIDSLIGDQLHKGFDFYSYHLYMEDMGIVKQAVVGDYHLLFGQGLNMWSSLAFGKSSNALSIKKYARGIKANTSTDENKFLRGAAVNLGYKRWKLAVFFSSKTQDATDFLNPDDQESNFLSSINGTGYHRTINELLKKDAVQLKIYGSNLSFAAHNIKLGITASHTQLDKEILPQTAPYQYFNFQGDKNTVIGGDYSFRLLMFNIFGEYSYKIHGGWAYLGGINANLSNRLALAFLYRNYQKDYVNLFGAAFGENTTNSNEQGFYTGISFQLSKKLKLNAYADIFKFPWLKFRVDAPSFGSEYLAQLDYEYSRKVHMQFKARYKNKPLNYHEDYQLNTELQEQRKYSFRYHISYQVHPLFTLKNRVEYQVYQTKDAGPQKGFLIYQDIVYKSKNKLLTLHARFALFDVEDYDSRIYAYENDLLYVFSIPAYYNRGIRVYGLMSYKINGSLQFWLKIAN